MNTSSLIIVHNCDLLLLDLDGLRIQCEQGAKFGFTGKQVIHPGQIDIVQNAFMPNKKQIEWAVGLLEAFEEHQKSGKVFFILIIEA